MRPGRIIASALLIIALILLSRRSFWTSSHQPPAPEEATAEKAQDREAVPAPSPIAPVASVPRSSTQAPRIRQATPPRAPSDGGILESQKLEGSLVPFEVLPSGLAVAYGDVLLGKVDPNESTIKRGYHDAPTPQMWDRPEIPYVISPELPNPKRVEKALEYLRARTPLNFVPHQGQKDVIVFEVGTEHCLSTLGRVGGYQPIKLSEGCQWQHILHEIMHALGFIHEQSRTDRDNYIKILWENIDPKYRAQFAFMPESWMEPLRGTSFDYHSLMLYDPHAFALKPDLLALQSVGSKPIAPVKEGLSEEDIARIKRMFGVYTH